jgi:hypothetical protein
MEDSFVYRGSERSQQSSHQHLMMTTGRVSEPWEMNATLTRLIARKGFVVGIFFYHHCLQTGSEAQPVTFLLTVKQTNHFSLVL